jgi:hypothetical protein
MIEWTSISEELLKKETKYEGKFQSWRKELNFVGIGDLKSELNNAKKISLENLIIFQQYYISVTLELVKKGFTRDSFEWIMLTRYYEVPEDKSINVSIEDQKFNYLFEYNSFQNFEFFVSEKQILETTKGISEKKLIIFMEESKAAILWLAAFVGRYIIHLSDAQSINNFLRSLTKSEIWFTLEPSE